MLWFSILHTNHQPFCSITIKHTKQTHLAAVDVRQHFSLVHEYILVEFNMTFTRLRETWHL